MIRSFDLVLYCFKEKKEKEKKYINKFWVIKHKKNVIPENMTKLS